MKKMVLFAVLSLGTQGALADKVQHVLHCETSTYVDSTTFDIYKGALGGKGCVQMVQTSRIDNSILKNFTAKSFENFGWSYIDTHFDVEGASYHIRQDFGPVDSTDSLSIDGKNVPQLQCKTVSGGYEAADVVADPTQCPTSPFANVIITPVPPT
jgi:hypothetical protein